MADHFVQGDSRNFKSVFLFDFTQFSVIRYYLCLFFRGETSELCLDLSSLVAGETNKEYL